MTLGCLTAPSNTSLILLDSTQLEACTIIYPTLLQTFISMVMVAVGNIDQLIDAFTASVWLFHGLAIGALLIMRITHQDVPRKFEVKKCAVCVCVSSPCPAYIVFRT